MSARHLSCIETGKARASREALRRLADRLAMPLRDRNSLLIAGGFAPEFTETKLQTPLLAPVRQAIELILRHQEPYPAFVVDRHWQVLHANDAAGRMTAFLMRGRAPVHTNLLHQVFDPEDLRPVFVNWEEVAGRFIRLLHEEIAAVPSDEAPRRLLAELLAYPDVPSRWRSRDPDADVTPILNLVFDSPAGPLRFFETITTFAGPRDITLEELRIECCFPADEPTAQLCATL